MMNGIFLLLGTNQGNRELNLATALKKLEAEGISILSESSIYQTAPWGITSQPDFLNLAVEINTDHTPEELLLVLKKIEKEIGRITTEKWGERIIDIDILYFNDQIIDTENLKIPHPQIINRRFTLIPLVEIAPSLIHPYFKLTQKELLLQCRDLSEVQAFKENLRPNL